MTTATIIGKVHASEPIQNSTRYSEAVFENTPFQLATAYSKGKVLTFILKNLELQDGEEVTDTFFDGMEYVGNVEWTVTYR